MRLPDDLVDYLDQLVAAGAATSRAAAVSRALAQERRRSIAARDAAILAHLPADPDLDDLAEYNARVPMDDLD